MSHIVGWSPDPILSNLLVYRTIAVDALAASEASYTEHTRQTEDGGLVTTLDPQQMSFRHSLIAIVFAGMYMEAALWVFGCGKLGIPQYKSIDRRPLEARATALGVGDQRLRDALQAYREARAELVHEKAVPLGQQAARWRTGQDEAKKAVDTMLLLEAAIGPRGGPPATSGHGEPQASRPT
jgi:hypothetical protein